METRPAWRTASHQGLREVNADAVAAANGVVALADGVGDTKTAAHAALLAATAAAGVPAIAGPQAALSAAHEAITAGDCVLVVAQPVADGGFRIGWVGDVRAYAWDGGDLRQLTTDHTLAQYMRDHGGDVTPRMAHIVTTSVHTATANRYGVTETSATSLVLTSDGVHKTLTHEAMTSILRHSSRPAEELVQAAHAAGAKDNATAAVLTGAPRPATPLLPTVPLQLAA
jgi:protein phosphatase